MDVMARGAGMDGVLTYTLKKICLTKSNKYLHRETDYNISETFEILTFFKFNNYIISL